MENKTKYIIGAVVVIFAAVIAWTVLTVPEPQKEDVVPETPKMEYGQNTISEKKGNKVIWEITTESSEIDAKTQETTFKNATGKFYEENGNVLTVTAPAGKYSAETKNVVLTGGVDAKTTDNMTLKADKVEWIAKDESLIATGSAVVTKPNMTASGDQIIAKDDFTDLSIKGNAHVTRK